VVLTGGNTAFTARGGAHVVQSAMEVAPDYAAVAVDVEQIDDHRQTAFLIEAGVDRQWLDAGERDASARAFGRSPSWLMTPRNRFDECLRGMTPSGVHFGRRRAADVPRLTELAQASHRRCGAK
jgi:hypothetical protein